MKNLIARALGTCIAAGGVAAPTLLRQMPSSRCHHWPRRSMPLSKSNPN